MKNQEDNFVPTAEGIDAVINYQKDTMQMILDSICPPKKVEEDKCYHQCSGNCRRVGCNCSCGEWHNLKES